MLRDVDINEISDGKFYSLNDMVKVGCDDCRGCSSCCRDMESIILDPYDVYRMTGGLERSFEDLLGDAIELKVVDGVVLPQLKMNEKSESCSFLNEEGRCSIHPYRPGICRLFPMGRYYEEEGFRYFLQVNECAKKDRYKVRMKQWLDTPEPQRYEKYISDWHYFIRKLGESMPLVTDRTKSELTTYLLRLFFMSPYRQSEDFYGQYEERMRTIRKVLAPLGF